MKEGARLPAERELAQTLCISRAELRKAMFVLEVEGRVERIVGRGTFLAKRAAVAKKSTVNARINELAERTGPYEAMTARIAIEPELASLAAIHASSRQLRDIADLAAAMKTAETWSKYEKLDSDFHDMIARASGNSLLHEVHSVINQVRMVVVWRRLSTPQEMPSKDYHSFTEHDAIVHALEQRDSSAAKKAMRKHLKSTLDTIQADDED
ncbi:Putative L-lactate dehydrogenase operon regulatory protein [Octadecabacter temperatus]|uniref:Putative L-lactate dehydrogenase operon regulatory protein n=2 Tax=Octadecabacter temperatus TaxID=1458307 RepID=A0A0K0Y3C6_9RHOB|nr:Putative L-lactate dehydrogenase operon regulatory protein [Octadecabacter temperatus]